MRGETAAVALANRRGAGLLGEFLSRSVDRHRHMCVARHARAENAVQVDLPRVPSV